MTILAAGAILWREENGKLKIAVIHRSRRDDWSFPKGKVDPGETLPQTAVREIAEETGIKIKLGIKLPTAYYKVPSGEKKEVHYWAGRVSDKALKNSNFKPSEEVAKVDWLTPDEARKVLTYEFDSEVLDALLGLYKKNLLRTVPYIVLRHAKATPRSDWYGGRIVDDGKRPLISDGKKQAKALVPLLAAFGPKRVITSPWMRCVDTVAPFANSRKFPLIERSQLSENGNKKGPKRTKNLMSDLLEDNKAVVICSHRPALPTILESIASVASKDLSKQIISASDLRPAEMLVMHIAKGASKLQVVAVERWGIEPALEK